MQMLYCVFSIHDVRIHSDYFLLLVHIHEVLISRISSSVVQTTFLFVIILLIVYCMKEIISQRVIRTYFLILGFGYFQGPALFLENGKQSNHTRNHFASNTIISMIVSNHEFIYRYITDSKKMKRSAFRCVLIVWVFYLHHNIMEANSGIYHNIGNV